MAGMGIVACLVLRCDGGNWCGLDLPKLPESSREQLTCRVPVFGQLYFLDSDGQPAATGINVGDTWMYRSHIGPGTQEHELFGCSGMWTKVQSSPKQSEQVTKRDRLKG